MKISDRIEISDRFNDQKFLTELQNPYIAFCYFTQKSAWSNDMWQQYKYWLNLGIQSHVKYVASHHILENKPLYTYIEFWK